MDTETHPTAEIDPNELGQRISDLLTELGGHAEPAVGEAAEEVAALLMEMYGAGLGRIMATLTGAGEVGAGLLAELVDDDLVASLLVLHDLHPEDTHARVTRALESVRPYLGSHAGGVELLGVVSEPDGEVVQLRLQGSCDGCPSSAITVKMAIEKAIEEICPEVVRVDVEGMNDPSAPALGDAGGLPPGAKALPLIQIGSAAAPSAPEVAVGWVNLSPPELRPGQCATLDVAGHSVLLALPAGSVDLAGGGMLAYRDHCPACAGELAGAPLVGERLACPSCAVGYDIRHAGRALDGSALHLEPLPLVRRGEGWRLALPRTPAGMAS
ncbi:MAG TPA: NifU family protein [Pseudonocardia sp.]|uniref:NifU family protein n=1 Tax=Pseudonocardia sp. TaxID=60912 RepID=UPI002B522F98|nr:NifU family protein [Pseudonocardia sp.]HTF54783.1 NifU family protein [Pseudonocardia sp.]